MLPPRYDSTLPSAIKPSKLAFLLPDEYTIAKAYRTAPRGILAITTKQDYMGIDYPQNGGISYKQIHTLSVLQWADLVVAGKAGVKPDRASFPNICIYAEKFLTAFGIPFIPLVNAINAGPMGPVPFDALVRPDYPKARLESINDPDSETRQTAFSLGTFKDSKTVRVVPRVEEWAMAKGLQVSYELVADRYNGIRGEWCGSGDDGML